MTPLFRSAERSPEVCVLNRQCCGTRDLGVQWWVYPGIPSFSAEAFVLFTACPVTNTTHAGKTHWPVGVCVCVGDDEDEIQKCISGGMSVSSVAGE